jgi:hypothetical protein
MLTKIKKVARFLAQSVTWILVCVGIASARTHEMPSPVALSLRERIENVQNTIHNLPKNQHEDLFTLAQWNNWRNWNNWGNFLNWNNWGNWGNFFNA